MPKVAIVTDSTAYIPPEMTRGLPITVIPLQVIWGEETYRDGVDIQPSEFYSRLKHTKVMPSTSQPSPSAFHEVYSRLLQEGYDILTLTISSSLSGTLDSASQAKNMLPKAAIELVDSRLTSMGLGFAVLLAARAAVEGATLGECKALAEKACSKVGILFVVSTLEFLHRGGRIGGAAALLGTALNLKPILELNEGKIMPVERVRTMSKALDRVIEMINQRVERRSPIRLAVIHASAPEEAEKLLERVRGQFNVSEVSEAVLSDVSPVIGTHTGPGTVGIVFMSGI